MELLIADPVLGLGAVMLIGFAGGRVATVAKLPALTGYIVAGLVFGPNVVGSIPQQLLDSIRSGPTHWSRSASSRLRRSRLASLCRSPRWRPHRPLQWWCRSSRSYAREVRSRRRC